MTDKITEIGVSEDGVEICFDVKRYGLLIHLENKDDPVEGNGKADILLDKKEARILRDALNDYLTRC